MKAQTFATDFDARGVPEIEHISYDLWELRITARFSPSDPPIYASFDRPSGFRVLDEGVLTDFWSAARPAGWIWRVDEGGWIDQEAARPAFIRDMVSGSEYMVLGLNDCVSVISVGPPRVRSAE